MPPRPLTLPLHGLRAAAREAWKQGQTSFNWYGLTYLIAATSQRLHISKPDGTKVIQFPLKP